MDNTAGALTHEIDGREQPRAYRNVAALFGAQAILSSQLMLHITFGPLVGALLAKAGGFSAAWATAPITVSILSSALVAAPASLLMARVGRRPGFLLGVSSGAAGGALAVYAMFEASFALFLLASAFIGVYQSFQGYFRFAAADTASARFKPTAIGWVLGGGIVAAPLASVVAFHALDAVSTLPYAGVYAAIVLVNLVGAIPVLFIDIPRPPRPAKTGAARGRSLREVFASPDARAALVAGMVSYALMSLVMTSTSTAMLACGLAPTDASMVISAHVVAMFAPSFFTGFVIRKIGHPATVAIGLGFLGVAGLVALTGVDIERFTLALILLGVGWNFGFIGATAWIASLHRPEEQGRVQAFNDACVFGLMAVASLSSGFAMNAFGWSGVNLLMIPFLVLVAGLLMWRRFQVAAAN